MARLHQTRVRSCRSFYPPRIESIIAAGLGAYLCLPQLPQRSRAVALAPTPNFAIFRRHLPVILAVWLSRELGLTPLSFALLLVYMLSIRDLYNTIPSNACHPPFPTWHTVHIFVPPYSCSLWLVGWSTINSSFLVPLLPL